MLNRSMTVTTISLSASTGPNDDDVVVVVGADDSCSSSLLFESVVVCGVSIIVIDLEHAHAACARRPNLNDSVESEVMRLS